jgi:organic radical activating enzyme
MNTDSIKEELHSDFWNSEYMKQARLTFLKGEHLPSCANCFGDPNRPEDERYYQKFNNEYGDRIQNILDQTNLETGETSYQPVDFDLRTNLCNMSCKTCGTYASTQSAAISNKAAGKTIFPIINIKDSQKRQSIDVNNILSEKTSQMYWAGGEPFMNPIYWDTLEYLKEKQWTHIAMTYHTNIKRFSHEPTYQKALANFNAFPSRVFVSIDGINEIAEYVRNGTHWPEIDANITKLLKDAPHIEVTLDATLTNLTLLQLPDILKYAQSKGTKIVFKAMIDSEGRKQDGLYHDRNTFLSTDLLKLETIQHVYTQCKEYLNKNTLDTHLLSVLEFIMRTHTFRHPNEHDQVSSRQMEQRHNNTLNIMNVIKNQSL